MEIHINNLRIRASYTSNYRAISYITLASWQQSLPEERKLQVVHVLFSVKCKIQRRIKNNKKYKNSKTQKPKDFEELRKTKGNFCSSLKILRRWRWCAKMNNFSRSIISTIIIIAAWCDIFTPR